MQRCYNSWKEAGPCEEVSSQLEFDVMNYFGTIWLPSYNINYDTYIVLNS